MDVKKVELYECGKCKKVYYDKEFAEKCCQPRYCETCGVEIKPYFFKCEPCRYKQMFDKAKLVEFDGGLAYDIVGDKYYEDLDVVEEDYEPGQAPEFLFACTPYKPQLDPKSIVDDLYEQVGDPTIEIELVDVHQIESFIERWNAKQKVGWYEPNYKQKVRRVDAYEEKGGPAD